MDLLLSKVTTPVFGWIVQLMGWIIDGVYILIDTIGIPNVGLAIILYTIIVYMLMYPLTKKQQKLSKMMSYIQPEKRAFPAFYDSINDRVGLIKMIPGIDFELLEFMLSKKDALIIECFGVGGLPSYSDDKLFEVIHRHTVEGKFIVVTTQVQNEGSDLSVYSVGHGLKTNPNVLEAYDMTTESVYAKIMWILGQTHESEEVSRLFYETVAHDILHRG